MPIPQGDMLPDFSLLSRRGAHTGIQLEVSLAPNTIDIFGIHGILKGREGNGVRVDVVSEQINVIKGVAGQVVAGIVLVTGRATPDRCLFFCFDGFGSGEESAGRDANSDEGAVIGRRACVRRCLSSTVKRS